MKYELIVKLLNSPITILDYLILISDEIDKFVKNEYLKKNIIFLQQQGYLSLNNKLTTKSKDLIDNLSKDNGDFFDNLHLILQNKLIELIGKKQKMLQGKYGFLPNSKDLKLRLQKLIKDYNLQDLKKIEKVLLLYIEQCNRAKFEYVQTIEYYLLKNNTSKFVTDYENYNENESIEQKEINPQEIKQLFE